MVPDAILTLDGVVAGYDTRIDILHGVSFEVPKGSLAAIIGPNGAGKSTIFNVIFGFVNPKQGAISFDGREVAHLSAIERLSCGITYAPQGRCNFPLMSIRENLEMAAYTRSDSGVTADIERVLQRYPIIGDRASELAGNLSGGMQQILEMAMVLLLNPKIVLLDEPSLGLAPVMMDMVFNEIRRMNEDGVTILMIEQNAKRALQIADHAIVLKLGRVALEGSGQELLDNDDVKKLYLGG